MSVIRKSDTPFIGSVLYCEECDVQVISVCHLAYGWAGFVSNLVDVGCMSRWRRLAERRTDMAPRQVKSSQVNPTQAKSSQGKPSLVWSICWCEIGRQRQRQNRTDRAEQNRTEHAWRRYKVQMYQYDSRSWQSGLFGSLECQDQI